jgi:hypothetical protein
MIKITDNNLLEKIREVEGDRWDRLFDAATYMPIHTAFMKWKASVEKELSYDASRYRERPFAWDKTQSNAVMFGSGRHNVYYVMGDETIEVSWHREEDRKKLIAAGFRIREKRG